MEECIKSGWPSRQLERQSSILYHEWLLASRDKVRSGDMACITSKDCSKQRIETLIVEYIHSKARQKLL